MLLRISKDNIRKPTRFGFVIGECGLR